MQRHASLAGRVPVAAAPAVPGGEAEDSDEQADVLGGAAEEVS